MASANGTCQFVVESGFMEEIALSAEPSRTSTVSKSEERNCAISLT